MVVVFFLNFVNECVKSILQRYFPSPQEYRKLLEANGFTVKSIEMVPRPTELNTDVNGWLTLFGFAFLEPLESDEERLKVLNEVIEHMRPSFQREDGKWFVMYVRLRVVAYKK